jgi:uncharacterized protein YcbK (DUF882 family)
MPAAIVVPHFSQSEIACRGENTEECKKEFKKASKNINKTLTFLQVLRYRWEEPLEVNSFFRCSVHNEKVGGAPNSYHVKGYAVDIDTSGWTIAKETRFIKLAESVGFKGVGIYDSFIHLDLREGPLTWGGRGQ